MPAPDPGLHDLARALELVAAHRRQPAGSDADLLAAHPELRELLEPLLADELANPPDAVGGPDAATLGDFRLLRELGRGGMGVVHEAVQISLGRRVALKLLPDPGLARPEAVARFLREGELLARLRHDHLVPVFAAGEAGGRHFFAMELVDGCSLAAVLERVRARPAGTLDGSALATALGEALATADAGATLRARSHAAAAVGLLLPVADALAHAHAAGIVHRDVKPANILLRPDGTPLLSDFGLARDLAAPSQTQTGDFAGTPHYVAPEQVTTSPSAIDGRADVFALGATLYELLTLRRAFDGPTSQAVLTRVLHGEPAPPRRLGIDLPEDLLAVLDRALRKAPAERYATMADFAADLRAVQEMRPVTARRPGPLGRLRRFARREPLRAALAAVLALGVPTLLALGGYLLVQRPRIAAAAERERRDAAETWLESAFVELGEGDPRLAVQRFARARELVDDLPEADAGLVLAHGRLGEPAAVAAARARLAVHPELLRELADEEVATSPSPGAAPPTALACYVRGMRRLELAHDRGDTASYRAAAAALREAIDRAPTARALFHCQYLHALYHLDDAAATAAFAQVVRDRWPAAPLVRYWVGFALEAIDPTAAMALQRSVLAERPDLLLAHVAIARLHERALRFADAIPEYEAVLAAAPDRVEALLGLARTLTHTGADGRAIELANRASALAPLSHMPHLVLGTALLELGQLDDAAASTHRAIALTPDDVDGHLLLARIALARDDFAAALAATERAMQLAPADAEPHLLAAYACHGLQREDEAAEHLERVVALDPQRPLAWIDVAYHREARGDEAAAAAAIAEAGARGADDATTRYRLGTWFKEHDQPELAERHLRRAIELDPAAAEPRVNLAALCWRQNRMAECLAFYRDAVRVAPDFETASEGLARALQREHRFDEAIAERQRWADAHADSPVAWLKLTALALAEPDAARLATAQAALARAEQQAGEPRADVLHWRGELLRARGEPRDAWEPLERQARALPNCSDDLRQRIDALLGGPR